MQAPELNAESAPKVFLKRDGRVMAFDPAHIYRGIVNAMIDTGADVDHRLATDLTEEIIRKIPGGGTVSAQAVYDLVLQTLTERGLYELLGAYVTFREDREERRDLDSKLMKQISKIIKETTKDNANVPNSPSAKMLQIASEASRWYTLAHMPKHLAKAHTNGDIHIHDLDYYEKTINCLQIPLERLLTDGFDAGRGYIRPPHRIGSAAALAAIVLQSNQNDMYGGQSFARFDTAMAKFVPIGYRKDLTQCEEDSKHLYMSLTASQRLVERIRNEVYQAMEGLVYNLNSMMSRAGSQVPFSSINFGTDTSPEGRLISEMLLKAFEAGLGKGETPLFPNLIFRIKDGINKKPGDPNYDLRELANRVAAKRMNPTFSNMDSSINAKWGDEVAYMGCRTRVMSNMNGPAQAEGRGNIGFITMNLPRMAIEAKGDMKKFYKRLDKILGICEESLLHRFETVARLKVKDLPFTMGQKLYIDSENYSPNDTIREIIKNGTLSVGYIGIAEALKVLVGKSHGESFEAQDEGLKIAEYIDTKVKEMGIRHHLNFTTLATPAEGLSGRFVGIDRVKFGVIPGVTDKGYYTNSFHIDPAIKMSVARKMMMEGPYHKFCDAGHISYVELNESPWLNPQSIGDIVDWAFSQDVGYMGINFPIDECPVCGKTGVIPGDCTCGCPDEMIRRIRRVTGYLSTVDRFTDGKVAELKARQVHDSTHGRN